MISNQRELGLARNMILFHNYVLFLLAQNLMFRNKNMIEGIINKMEDTEETDIDALVNIEGKSYLMMKLNDGFHNHDNDFG